MFQYPAYPSATYGAVFAVSFWAWFLFEIWVFARDRGKAQGRSVPGARWMLVAIVVAVTLAVNLPVLAPGFDLRSLFPPVFVAGIVLAWAGIVFRFWAIRTLGDLFSTRLMIQEGHALITRGPYKYVRNPSYTGALLTFVGIGMGIGNWLSLSTLVLMTLIAYILRIRTEDRMLQEAFGQEYAEYQKTTWALIPFIW